MDAIRILLGAAFTVAVCLALGGLVLRARCTDWGGRFVVGAAVWSVAMFAVCAAGIAYAWVLIMLGLIAVATGFTLAPPKRPHGTATLWLIPFGVYAILYLCHAMAPEASADGAGYHLGLVARYLQEHGFVRITDNMYAGMPGGVEMLFLLPFAIGGHSSTAVLHLAFLASLAWQMYGWSKKAGFATVGVCAALLVVASPLIGVDATSAYNDVALGAAAFTVFHLLELDPVGLAIPIGLAAGFGFATKYTAWVGVIYAVGLVGWRNRRSAVWTAATATLVAGPWILKNWMNLQNPVAPLFNRIFPNPYVMASFEDTYRYTFAHYGLTSNWQIPMEAAVRGGLTGVLGPIFLLAPVGLLALRRPEGRRLWLAALVFGANYFGNIGARFLIPSLPFLALAMMMALAAIPRLAIAIALIHAVISWPALLPKYARPGSWRLEKFPWKEALRIKPAEGYLESHLIGYGVDRLIEEKTRPGSTVFTFTPIPEAYTTRHIRVEFQATENKISGALLWTAVEPTYVPTWRLRFLMARRPVKAIRLVQTGSGQALWSIHELRFYDGTRELARDSSWRLTAKPYPWGIQNAFDNSLATFWMSGEWLRPGQTVEVQFGREEMLDSAVMESAPNQTALRLRLEGMDGAGKWRVLSLAPAINDAPRPLGLRRAVAAELKRRGNDYVLLFDGQVGSDDFRVNADLWNAVAVGEYKGARLYELR